MPTSGVVPRPPDFEITTPLLEVWPSHEPIVRVYGSIYRPDSFNPGTEPPTVRGRFHSFASTSGATVPVLYGSDQEDGAISETVFHDVPVVGSLRTVPESRLQQMSMVTLEPLRDLKLVQLLGHGLRRLQLRAGDLTDTESDQYPHTVQWAQALHATIADADGMVWMSRQFNAAKSLMLFGDRVRPDDLAAVSLPLPLRMGPGRTRVDQAANAAGILIL